MADESEMAVSCDQPICKQATTLSLIPVRCTTTVTAVTVLKLISLGLRITVHCCFTGMLSYLKVAEKSEKLLTAMASMRERLVATDFRLFMAGGHFVAFSSGGTSQITRS